MIRNFYKQLILLGHHPVYIYFWYLGYIYTWFLLTFYGLPHCAALCFLFVVLSIKYGFQFVYLHFNFPHVFFLYFFKGKLLTLTSYIRKNEVIFICKFSKVKSLKSICDWIEWGFSFCHLFLIILSTEDDVSDFLL